MIIWTRSLTHKIYLAAHENPHDVSFFVHLAQHIEKNHSDKQSISSRQFATIILRTITDCYGKNYMKKNFTNLPFQHTHEYNFWSTYIRGVPDKKRTFKSKVTKLPISFRFLEETLREFETFYESAFLELA